MNAPQPFRILGLLLPFLVLVLGGAICQPPEALPPNEAPVAKLVWPQLWLVDEPVPFDASASVDFDGLISEYNLIFGDGTEAQSSTDGIFEHLYIAPGTWAFRLEIRDDEGSPAEILGTVITVERLDDPVCDCTLPCLDDALCTVDGCFLRASRQGTGPFESVDGGVDEPQLPPVDDVIACGDE